MERVQELIDKLWKQNQQQEGPQSLLNTVQQLQEALSALVRTEAPKGTGKVSVVLPPKRRIATVEVAAPQPAAARPAPAIAEVQEPAAEVAAPPAEAPLPAPSQPEIPEQHRPFIGESAPAQPNPVLPATPVPQPESSPLRQPYTLHKPPATEPPVPVTVHVPQAQENSLEPEPVHLHVETIAPVPHAEAAPQAVAPEQPIAPEPKEEREVFHLHFDMPEEAPTLTQQFAQQPKELHELIGQKGESLNDRLKQERPELGNKLKETPIKDLRKAIGLNDKFLFIKELFRGDEAMYERSIKTINNFHILAEAEYWISRELKVKLGWDDSSDAAQAFYQLVRRRFA